MYRENLQSFVISFVMLRNRHEGVFDLVTLKEGRRTEFVKDAAISTRVSQGEHELSKLYKEARNVRQTYEAFMTCQ